MRCDLRGWHSVFDFLRPSGTVQRPANGFKAAETHANANGGANTSVLTAELMSVHAPSVNASICFQQQVASCPLACAGCQTNNRPRRRTTIVRAAKSMANRHGHSCEKQASTSTSTSTSKCPMCVLFMNEFRS